MNTSPIFAALSIIISIFYLSTFTYHEVHCAAIDVTTTYRNPIVYRRYIRRRPPVEPGDQHVEEVVEVFHTQQKPPPLIKNPMSDEDIDKFIFCDFHRETDECKQYWNSRNHVKPTIKRPADIRPPTVKPPATPPFSGVTITEATTITSTTTRSTSTTSTTTPTAPNSSTTTSTATPTHDDIFPRIPDLLFDEDNDIDDNFDDYDGAMDADEEDEEDQEQSTTTFRSPFNLFG